uniref:Cell wall protein-like n=1 Tax=Oryza sativa subsp. japonica TaxID=39947 RepID=Q6Z1W4_ORYSJ|nr:cell wall protein-like [Oryza sativa Japonica Group]BAD17334.1 cell wall protein-like [Oryza sativa Japonica Group]
MLQNFAGTPPCSAGLSIRLAGISPVGPSFTRALSAAPPQPPASQRRAGDIVLGIASPPSKPLCSPSSSSPFVLVVDVPSVARLVVLLRRNHRRHHSDVFRAVLASVQLLPAALIASSPVPVVILPSYPVVVAFVPPSSRSRSPPVVRQASRCSPIVVFVLGSASSSLVPAASRLRPRIAAEVVCLCRPRAVSAAPVRRRRAAPFRVVVTVPPLAAPSSSFRCCPVPVVRLSTPAGLEVHGSASSTSATIRTGLRASVAKHYRTNHMSNGKRSFGEEVLGGALAYTLVERL